MMKEENERNVKIGKIRYLDWGWFDIQAETSRTITEGMRLDENRFGVFPNQNILNIFSEFFFF